MPGTTRPPRLNCLKILIAPLALALWLTQSLPAADPPTNQTLGDFEAQADVGKVDPPGAAEYDKTKNQYTLKSSGENIWAKHDDFHFVYRKLSGDCSLTADITLVGQGKNAHRKAGLMIRQSLDPDAPYVDVVIHGDGMIALQYRPAKGEITKDIKSKVKSPATVKIERQGDAFTVAIAPKTDKPAAEPAFQPTGSIKVELKDPIYAGLALSAHDASTIETAVFTNVAMKDSKTTAP
jgi:TolB protein